MSEATFRTSGRDLTECRSEAVAAFDAFFGVDENWAIQDYDATPIMAWSQRVPVLWEVRFTAVAT